MPKITHDLQAWMLKRKRNVLKVLSSLNETLPLAFAGHSLSQDFQHFDKLYWIKAYLLAIACIMFDHSNNINSIYLTTFMAMCSSIHQNLLVSYLTSPVELCTKFYLFWRRYMYVFYDFFDSPIVVDWAYIYKPPSHSGIIMHINKALLIEWRW